MTSNKWAASLLFLHFLTFFLEIETRRHRLNLKNDVRRFFKLSSFGYLPGGSLTVDVFEFSINPFLLDSLFGLILAKTTNGSLFPSLEGHRDRCLLLEDVSQMETDNKVGMMSMIMDFKNTQIKLRTSPGLSAIKVFQTFFKEEEGSYGVIIVTRIPSSVDAIEMTKKVKDGHFVYSFKFNIPITDESQGTYSLYFNNCPNYGVNEPLKIQTKINLSMFINEDNADTGDHSPVEKPNKILYFILVVFGFALGVTIFGQLETRKAPPTQLTPIIVE